MQIKTILLIVAIIILLFIVIRYIMSDVSTLSGLVSGQTMQTIDATTLAKSSNNSINFTYSIWFYVDDWNYNYGTKKYIFGRMTSGTSTTQPCPAVTLGAVQNNLDISLTVYPGLNTKPTSSSAKYIVNTCSLANVPIQKWVNLIISTYGRSLDVYIDGKLVKTCVLPGVSKIDSTAPVYITPNGGFSGWTSKFQYWAESCNPQTAWNIYKAGYGGSSLSNLFGKYKVKVTFIEGDVEQNSFEI